METLPNGATVLHSTPCPDGDTFRTALCFWKDEYIVWTVNADNQAFWGHYFGRNIFAAIDCYKVAIGGDQP